MPRSAQERERTEVRDGVAALLTAVAVFFGGAFGSSFWIADLYNAGSPWWPWVFGGTVVLAAAIVFPLMWWGIGRLIVG